MDRVAEDFEEHRPALLGLAYRLLGSMWDAEDVVQDAYVRWSRVDRDEVRDPRAYLVTVVSRLALDQLLAVWEWRVDDVTAPDTFPVTGNVGPGTYCRTDGEVSFTVTRLLSSVISPRTGGVAPLGPEAFSANE